MKTLSFFCTALLITVASFSQKQPEAKPALKVLIKKYPPYSFQTTKAGFNGYKEYGTDPVTITWDKWEVSFQGDKNQYINLFLHYHVDGFGKTPMNKDAVFALMPYAKNQVVKKNNNKFGGGELVFYRSTLDGKSETEYIRLQMAPADQDEFIKMLQAVYKDYGCTLSERTP